MTDRAIILGEFVDYRRVKGRKVLQLYIEVSLEDELATLNALGAPEVGGSNWVSVARLTPEAVALLQAQRGAQAAPTNSTADKPAPSPGAVEQTPVDSSTESAGARGRKWNDLPYSQQAAIRCGEPAFQAFVKEASGADCSGERDAAVYVRSRCNIQSRSELNDPRMDWPRHYWTKLEAQYQSWKADRQFRQSKHG